MSAGVKDRVRKVPPRTVDFLSELVKRNHNTDRSVPVLRLEDVTRDKPTTPSLH